MVTVAVVADVFNNMLLCLPPASIIPAERGDNTFVVICVGPGNCEAFRIAIRKHAPTQSKCHHFWDVFNFTTAVDDILLFATSAM